MASVSNLSVSFNARTKGFERAMRRLERRLRGTRRIVSKLGAAAGLVAGGGMGLLLANSFKNVDVQAKVADKLGATTEELMGLQFAANLAGIETRTLNMASQRLVRRLAEAAIGTGEAKDALKTLGINAKVLNNAPLEEKMLRVADALQGVSNQGERVRLAFKLFDSEGVALVNLMQQGSGAIREALEEARQLGLTVSRLDAAKVEVANDAFMTMRTTLSAIFNQVAVKLSPAVFALANVFIKWAKDSGGAAAIAAKGLNFVLDIAISAVEVFDTMKAAVFGVAGAFGKFVSLVLKFADFAQKGGPVGLILGGLFGVDFDPVKFASGLDLGDMSDSVGKAADDALSKSAQLFGRVGLGEVGSSFKGLLDGLGATMDEAAAKKLASPITSDAIEKAASKKSSSFKQVSLSRTAFGAPGGSSKEQKVRDPQLEVTNQILRGMASMAGRSGGLAFG